MSDDLPTRLRRQAESYSWRSVVGLLCDEAADRIDALTVAHRTVSEWNDEQTAEIEQLRAVVNHPIIDACIRMNRLQFPELEVPR